MWCVVNMKKFIFPSITRNRYYLFIKNCYVWFSVRMTASDEKERESAKIERKSFNIYVIEMESKRKICWNVSTNWIHLNDWLMSLNVNYFFFAPSSFVRSIHYYWWILLFAAVLLLILLLLFLGGCTERNVPWIFQQIFNSIRPR